MTAQRSTPMIEVRDMTKNFGITIALNQVSFSMFGGNIYGLIGENGSGKSTVSSIIAGIQPATKGEMFYKGKPWKPADMLHAQQEHICMVVQEAGTIGSITVAENIFMGHEELFANGIFVSKAKMISAAQELLDQVGISDIKASELTSHYDMQARKLIEIAKCMYWKPEVFIVDETTTALSQTGRAILYRLMHQLADQGKLVIFISHDLEEMLEHCNFLTVLRDGVMQHTFHQDENNPTVDSQGRPSLPFEPNAIKKDMVGREISGDYYHADLEGYSSEVALRAENITTLHDLINFNLEVHKGEILGIGGLSDCGMHTLGHALFGVEKVLAGQVTVQGKAIRNPRQAIASKVGYVSKNRDVESLGLSATIAENIASTGYVTNRFLRYLPFISFRKEKQYVLNQKEQFRLKCASVNHTVDTLSGGNKQKVVFGKWMAADSEVLILDCPTRGIDIGVKADIYQFLYEKKKEGKAIILISEEMAELIGMSDRLIIMKKDSAENAQITYERKRAEGFNEHEIIERMI